MYTFAFRLVFVFVLFHYYILIAFRIDMLLIFTPFTWLHLVPRSPHIYLYLCMYVRLQRLIFSHTRIFVESTQRWTKRQQTCLYTLMIASVCAKSCFFTFQLLHFLVRLAQLERFSRLCFRICVRVCVFVPLRFERNTTASLYERRFVIFLSFFFLLLLCLEHINPQS